MTRAPRSRPPGARRRPSAARRLLLVPAVALVALGAPAVALDGTPAPVPGSVTVPLALPEVVGPGVQAETRIAADVVGVTWKGDPAAEFRVEVRRKRSGPWTPAATVGAADVRPDDGSPDARAATGRPNASEPVWVARAEQVRITVVQGTVGGLALTAVTANPGQAPSGSAGALAGGFGTPGDRFAFALALVLAGGILAAVAAGWSPWRSRRTVALLGVIGLVAVTACAPSPPPSPNPVVASQPAMTLRASWGPDLAWKDVPDCAAGPEYADDVDFLVVHHTVNSNTYGPSESRTMVRAIWRYHVETLGFCDIAYNFVIDRFGQIFEGRRGGVDRAVVAAHAGGFNRGSSGVALLGDFTAVQPSTEAWNALVSLLAWKASAHRKDPAAGFTATSAGGGGARWPAGTPVSFPNRIVGHRDLGATACPGNAFYPRLAELRTAVQPRVGWLGPAPAAGPAGAAVPSTIPSTTPTTTPTTLRPTSTAAPSVSPSTSPSTIPSTVPSTTVSTTPSTAPSTAPPTTPPSAPASTPASAPVSTTPSGDETGVPGPAPPNPG
jgi:hypothetical protein